MKNPELVAPGHTFADSDISQIARFERIVNRKNVQRRPGCRSSTSNMVAIALIEGSSVVRILPQTKVESVLPPPIVKGGADEVIERDRGADQRGTDKGARDLRYARGVAGSATPGEDQLLK